jgi:hypothetical protein
MRWDTKPDNRIRRTSLLSTTTMHDALLEHRARCSAVVVQAATTSRRGTNCPAKPGSSLSAANDKITADDLIAIKFLSVDAPKAAARDLLRERAQHFAALLIDLGGDRDLALETSSVQRPWPGWTLLDELKEIPGVGTTIATKLLARKRPKLVPIWDSVVAAVTDTVQSQWEPLRLALGANDSAVHHRLIGLRDRLRLPKEISALRVLDVIAWREGKDRGL